MSHLITRTLFGCASVALTLAMVAASSPATASAPTSEARQTTLRINDLDLASAAGQQTFARRLNAAVIRVCPAEGLTETMRCRSAAIRNARADMAKKVAASS